MGLFSKSVVKIVIVEEYTNNRFSSIDITTTIKTMNQLKQAIIKANKELKATIKKLDFEYRLDSKVYFVKNDEDVIKMIQIFSKTNKIQPLYCKRGVVPDLDKPKQTDILRKKLAEKYQLPEDQINHLGSGATGFIFEVPPLNPKEKPFAVKVTKYESEKVGEIQTIFSLKHDHIVKSENFYIIDNVSYFKKIICFEMEKMEGSLKTLQKDSPVVSEQVAIMIINQIAQALQECLNRNILHRDIKPDNILVKSFSKDGIHVVLTDFDRALVGSCLGREVELSLEGTESYLAPELDEDGNNFSILSDIFSLGVTMYHLIMGQATITGRILCENLDQAEKEMKSRNISPILMQLILGMIQKEPEQRMTLDMLLNLTNQFLNSKKQIFILQEDSNLYHIEIPLYPKYEELCKIIENKIGYNDFNIVYNQKIITNDSECYQMMTNLLIGNKMITLKLIPIEQVLQNISKNYENQNYAQTLQYCIQYLKRNSSSPSCKILTTAANCCFHLIKYEKAIEYFNQVYSKKEWRSKIDVKFYERFAYCNYKLGKYERASELYTKTLTFEEKYKVLLEAGICAMKIKQFERSIKLLTKSYQLNKRIEVIDVMVQVLKQLDSPTDINSWTSKDIAWLALGIFKKEMNQVNESKILLEMALKLSPQDQNIINALILL